LTEGAKDEPAKRRLSPYVGSMDSYAVSRRVAPGSRIVHHSMPARLIGELDLAIAAERVHDRWFNRSEVTATAIRGFLDQGGLSALRGQDPLEGLRSVRRRETQFHLPATLVVEYSTHAVHGQAGERSWEPWEVVAIAILRFLDQGGMRLMNKTGFPDSV